MNGIDSSIEVMCYITNFDRVHVVIDPFHLSLDINQQPNASIGRINWANNGH